MIGGRTPKGSFCIIPARGIQTTSSLVPVLDSSPRVEGHPYMPEDLAGVLHDQKMLATIPEGKIFGEVALLSNDPRSASILAIEDCTFMVVYRREFEIIKQCYSHEFIERRAFLTSVMPSIDSMKEMRSLMKFLQYFEVVTFSRVSRV